MNTISKTSMTIEHHCLQLPYASLRLQKHQWLDQLVLSMENVGQLVPVVVVPANSNQWILMDGYLRVKALRRMGQDVVAAEVWNCDVATAMLTLLTEHQSRTWEVFEEALILQELVTQHGFSQNQLANKIGRDQSWVSRRLLLLEQLPEPLLQAVAQGKLSVWSAVRVLAPMARAIPEHAECLLQHVLNEPHSTRELKSFYDHYQQSAQPQRSNMVGDPGLFFKAQKLLTAEKEAHVLQAGLEGKWCSQLRVARQALKALVPLVPQLFTSYQDTQIHAELLNALHETEDQLQLLTKLTRSLSDAYQRHAADDYQSAPKGQQPPSH